MVIIHNYFGVLPSTNNMLRFLALSLLFTLVLTSVENSQNGHTGNEIAREEINAISNNVHRDLNEVQHVVEVEVDTHDNTQHRFELDTKPLCTLHSVRFGCLCRYGDYKCPFLSDAMSFLS